MTIHGAIGIQTGCSTLRGPTAHTQSQLLQSDVLCVVPVIHNFTAAYQEMNINA
jgi:hypothetical protein